MKINNFKQNVLYQYCTDLLSLMPKKLFVSIFLMIILSLSEGVSLLVLIPMLNLIGLDLGQGYLNQTFSYFSILFAYLGFKPTLVNILFIYVLIIVLIAVIARYITLQTSSIQYQFAARIRKELYSSITNSDWIFITRLKSSNITHALTNEVERISVGTGQFLTLLASIMILAVYLLFAVKIAGIITCLIFVIGILILYLLRKRASKSLSIGLDISSNTQDLYSSATQDIVGIKTIKSFGIQEKTIENFSKKTKMVAKTYFETMKSYADVKFLFDAGTVIILALMVFVVLEWVKLSIAMLLLLIYIFVKMIPQFSTVQRTYQYFINMLPAYTNVKSLEKQCIEHTDVTSKPSIKVEFKNNLTLKNVSFSYGSKDFSINNINLKIKAGKTTAIVGSSGAGKSTIADILMGLITPDNGLIIVNNTDLTSNLRASMGDHIGYVSQETFLFNETVRFNLQLAKPEANELDLMDALKMASAYDFVVKLPNGIDTIIGDRGSRLSGGERQRIALARALVKKPSLLILDESTSNIDSENERKILRSIENLHGKLTVLIIAHNMSTIKNADTIYLMDDGKIIDHGTWYDLINRDNDVFMKLYEI